MANFATQKYLSIPENGIPENDISA